MLCVKQILIGDQMKKKKMDITAVYAKNLLPGESSAQQSMELKAVQR